METYNSSELMNNNEEAHLICEYCNDLKDDCQICYVYPVFRWQ